MTVAKLWAGVTMVAGLLLSAGKTAERPFTGAFEGTGRACAGTLSVRPKTISWTTPFSTCRNLAYEVVEHSEKGNERRVTLHMKPGGKSCLYSVLYLYHGDSADNDIDWHVIGYRSFDEYKADQQNGFKADSPDALSCSLVTR